VEKIAEVVKAAEAEPEKFGKLLEDMDRTGRVNGVFKRLRVMKQAALIRAVPPPLPSNGPYAVIVADPPWPHEARKDDPSQRGKTPFPQMSRGFLFRGHGKAPVRRIMRAAASPVDAPWLWTLAFGQHEDRAPTHGYEATREAA
jgi:hypothetical protein